MPHFIVKRAEVHYQYVEVEAENAEDAIREAAEAGGLDLERYEFLYTLEPHEEPYEAVEQPAVVERNSAAPESGPAGSRRTVSDARKES